MNGHVGRIEAGGPQLRPDAAVGRELGSEHRLEAVEPVGRVGDVGMHAGVEQHQSFGMLDEERGHRHAEVAGLAR